MGPAQVESHEGEVSWQEDEQGGVLPKLNTAVEKILINIAGEGRRGTLRMRGGNREGVVRVI
jgi:hypothetical protein